MTSSDAPSDRAVPHRPQKFAQPTVETCSYRRTAAGQDNLAWCALLQQISGLSDVQPCMVHRDACESCCRSFPPTLESWNSVIASHLIDVADAVLAEDGLSGCSAGQAAQLRQQALGALEISCPPEQFIRPLRVDRPCCFLGPIQSTDDSLPATEATYVCRHPAHGATTAEQCRRCREWSSIPPRSRLLTTAELVPPDAARSEAQIRQWSVGILTAPRRVATLECCLDSVVRAGWDCPHLYIDGLVRIPNRYLHLPVTWRERPLGVWPNTYLALLEMIQRDPRADAYLLVQDDAFLFDRGNLREYLESALWPGDRPSVVSLYCPQPYNKTAPGWHTRSEPWVWGAQVFLFSPAAALEFVRSPEALAHRWAAGHDGRAQVDVLIGQWAADRGWPIWFPNPSLAQHIGNTSSIWHDARIAGWRRADWYAGDLESPFARESSMSDFPEQLFVCRDEFREEYRSRVEIGRERMAHRRVVVCGLCRDVRHFLPKFAARVERLGAMFGDYRVVLFENDSTDATLEFLLDWRTGNDRVHVLSEQLGAIRYPQIRSGERATRMAEYRNRCLRYALDHFADFDHLLVADTDLAGGWSYDGLANTFGQDDWDFVGSYGLLRVDGEQSSEWLQFDAWAFRAMGHPQPHANVEVNSMVFDRGEPLLPVLSCFGGLGVYRLAAVQGARYGSPDMEHSELHCQMRQQGFGRLFLNPSQIVLYSPE